MPQRGTTIPIREKTQGKTRFVSASASPSSFSNRRIFNLSSTNCVHLVPEYYSRIPCYCAAVGAVLPGMIRRNRFPPTDSFTKRRRCRNPRGVPGWKNRKTVWWLWCWIGRHEGVNEDTACNAILHLCRRSGRRLYDTRNHSYDEDPVGVPEVREQYKHEASRSTTITIYLLYHLNLSRMFHVVEMSVRRFVNIKFADGNLSSEHCSSSDFSIPCLLGDDRIENFLTPLWRGSWCLCAIFVQEN
ncbi:hypothetical protein BDR03DRAFT_961049 [Suillus americanus]|nr:hypothetical protein BDR03DRAFT_961049 [Suillus americanus]